MKKITQNLPGGSLSATALLLLLLIVPFLVYKYVSKGTNNFVKLAVIGSEGHQIPDFAFLNQSNDTITNADYDNYIYIADFFFTRCPTICPVMTYNMKYIQKKLNIYPGVKFLSFTVDPENDTPEVLREYIKSMRINDENWNFLTGSKDSIYSIANSYFAHASEDSTQPGGYSHSGQLILVDKEGRVRSGYSNFVCRECGDVSKKSLMTCPTTGKNFTYEGNPVGTYDGTKDHIIKDLIKDVKTLLAEYHNNPKIERLEKQ
ncbi:MAG: hypothetical protein CMD02_03085 [Flavobacteriales bacterium]|nr:hypothetical protein [Flavobacteriales bacterium]|tara:strand:- start:5948 stop:6730 length:783 start_codon:yes stop_codon:yes gene_type:complete